MNTKQKDILRYVIAMVSALIASFCISPIWGGTALFWIGLAVAVFFVFAILGTLYGHKLDK